MPSKEEIEKAKENITKYLNDIWFGTLYSQEENDRDEKILLEYIDQLESDKQKLIEKLEEDKMEQFDDYIIYLIESYLKILKGENDEH